jgi:hypothetical protein
VLENCLYVHSKKMNIKQNYLHPNCFRLISILNSFSKMFEKVFLAKLKGLESSQNWFSPSQHGFRPGYSTETASLLKLTETDKKNKIVTCCAFLDIKSVFDAA